jgi:hypothetical protein
MKKTFLCSTVLSTAVMATLACQRSPGFKHDQEYFKEEPQSYYNKAGPGKTPSQRIEAMGQPKKKVFILDFWNDTPVKQADLGNFAAEELRRALYSTQRMILPTDAKTTFGTFDFVQGDRVKVAQLIREGRRLGVSILAIGRVTKIVFRQRGDEVGLFRQKQSLAGVDMEVKLFDVPGGREITALGKSGEASANSLVAFETSNLESPEYRAELTKLAVRNAVSQMVPDVIKSVEKMTWEGHIARIIGNKVYVNAGKASGLVSGDILKVLTQGDDIYDPTTGAYLGRSVGQLKGTLEVVDFIGTDGAVSEVHTGGNFQEGDVVRLY